MNLSTTTTDNITEVLIKIVEFTQRRHEILTRNIVDADREGFMPKDLDVNIFADVLTEAVAEHIQRERLLFRDSENIKFGTEGKVDFFAKNDERAKQLLVDDKASYIDFEIKKISENRLNNVVAAELLLQTS